MTKYYVTPKDGLGYRHTISERQGQPVDMAGVGVVTLPDGDYLTVISRAEQFPAHEVALAVADGKIKIDDVQEVRKITKTWVVWSGEGEQGHMDVIRATDIGIMRILTLERAGGDRWAWAAEYTGDEQHDCCQRVKERHLQREWRVP